MHDAKSFLIFELIVWYFSGISSAAKLSLLFLTLKNFEEYAPRLDFNKIRLRSELMKSD
jgi:hypothetical protein